MGKIKFGTDGWRAVIGEEFTFSNISRVASRLKQFLGSGRICVGYDNRFLSPEYAAFFCSVLNKLGFETDLSDSAVTTPMVSYRTKYGGYTLGIMFSASHNPAQYNGLKIKLPYGGSANDAFVRQLTDGLDETSWEKHPAALSIAGLDRNKWSGDYLSAIGSVLPVNGFKVVCDYMNGPAAMYFGRILNPKGYELKELRNERDPLFSGVSPEPKPATLPGLVDIMNSGTHDIGFAFDGDGDRIAVVDEKGRLLSMQILLAVLAYDLLEQGKKGTILKTVAGTYLVDRLAKIYGVKTEMLPIGFKNICHRLIDGDVLVGGEESGGIGFGDFLPERDAMYTAVRCLELMSRRKTLIGRFWDEISEKIGGSHYLREDISLSEKADKELLKKNITDMSVQGRFPEKINSIIEIDGLRIEFESGSWLLIRPSGTEPVLRIYAEAESAGTVKELIRIGKETVR